MSAITISREFGCVGDEFGAGIAQRLGYHFVDREFITSLLQEYGMVDFDAEYDARPGFWERLSTSGDQRKQMVDLLNQVVQAVAQHGDVVIQGRSGFAILAEYADVLHVRLQAPLAGRIERVMAQQHLTAEQAAEVVKEADQVRKAFVEEYYGVPWDSIHAFDLVMDTGKISPDLAGGLLADAVKAWVRGAVPGQPTTRSLEVDNVLARAIAKALECERVHN